MQSPFCILCFVSADSNYRRIVLTLLVEEQEGNLACKMTGVCGQGMSNVFAAPPIKYFKIFFRLSIPKHNPNLKP